PVAWSNNVPHRIPELCLNSPPRSGNLKGSLVRLLADESTPHWPLYAMTATRTVASGIRDLISFVTNELAATELAEVAELPPR
ncbi:hypothetical protein, partial [Accumulibacter sp.]|uniref:hypothetical protein n=1 Tax=Accumulibacter sp. TaxID=2053492 RepID=UPI002623EC93